MLQSQVKDLSLADFPEEIQQAYGFASLEKLFSYPDERLQHIYLLHFSAPAGQLALCERLQQLPKLARAEPIPYVISHYQPNDFDSTELAHLVRVRAPEAWDLERGDSHVVIAVMDDAFLISHQELAPQLWHNPGEIPGDGLDNDGNGYQDDWQGYDVADDDPDPSPPNRAFRHGSHVAGCAVAATDNGIGVASLGFGCSLLPVKLATDNGPANTYPFDHVLKGLDYLLNVEADIVNMSFGTSQYSLIGQLLIDIGHEKGMIFVASAGNGPSYAVPNDTLWEYPAAYDHVISVSATDAQDRKAAIATHNSRVDVCAPGLQIKSTVPSISLGSSYTRLSGTSMAAPIVSGLLGLMLSHHPCLGPEEAEALLKQSCQPIDSKNPGLEGKLGAGRIDAFEALRLLQRGAAPSATFALPDSIICDSLLRPRYLPDSLAACPMHWRWWLNGQWIDSSASPVIKLDSSGSYQLALWVGNALGQDSFSLQRNFRLASPPRVEAGPSLSIRRGDTLQLQASGDAQSYRWQPADLCFPSPFRPNPFTAPSQTQTYVVWGESQEGCRAWDSLTVFVDTQATAVAEKIRIFQAISAAWDQSSRQILLRGKLGKGGEVRVGLYGINGKKQQNLLDEVLPAGTFRRNIPLFFPVTSGIYLLRWQLRGQVLSQKILIP
jgi:hypothetical protein